MSSTGKNSGPWPIFLCLTLVLGTPAGLCCYGFFLPRAFPFSFCVTALIILGVGAAGAAFDLAVIRVLGGARKTHREVGSSPLFKLFTALAAAWVICFFSLGVDERLFLIGAKLRLESSIDCRKLELWANPILMIPPKRGSPARVSAGKSASPAKFDGPEFELPNELLPDDVRRRFPRPSRATVVCVPGQLTQREIVIGAYGDRLGLYLRIGPQYEQEALNMKLCNNVSVCLGAGG